ncbi:MAG: sensor histidine kinase [Candidatus Dormibacteria bacterium]
MVAAMGHELRSPLSAVIGLSALLMEDPDGDPASRELFLGGINSSGRFLLSLVNHTADYARVVAGETPLDRRVCDLGQAVATVSDRLRPLAMSAAVELHAEIAAPLVMADDKRLQQVLFNLGLRAVRRTPAGGAIVITALSTERGVVVSLPNGASEPAADRRETLFDPFVAANPDAIPDTGRVQLDLELCRALALAMGGDLTLAEQTVLTLEAAPA